MKSKLAQARDEWITSKEGQKCLDVGILSSSKEKQYLENRLYWAFIAGAKAQERIYSETA